MRKAEIKRKTKETSIELNINLDGTGKSSISTPFALMRPDTSITEVAINFFRLISSENNSGRC